MNVKERVRDRLMTARRIFDREVLAQQQDVHWPVHPVIYDNGYKARLSLDVRNFVKALVFGSNATFRMEPSWPVFRGDGTVDFKEMWRPLPDAWKMVKE